MNIILQTILVGIGATIFMDLYALVLNLFNIKTLDYRFLGRWIGNFFKGNFYHSKITESPVITFEKPLGWITHYLIGITFSFILVLCFGIKWLENPTVLPALFIGIIAILGPFFIMQPAFGFGIAGSKLPNPSKARIMSFITHVVFGIGLFVSAYALCQIVKIL
ncbi:DUF2938 domain-containing protein [Winogradskyella endarachnes]|uniref:DUF2938 family protein n=1 Tax=Winogradskyella endarachnes TaxID=2681965 RepID=A0A6L6U920_9FLAO|nr:DUF2938 domain-containing protein [Winogradskyella endarachnes]MUU78678.1 DUF2938 family protein [Winogradskyella endarachnes]